MSLHRDPVTPRGQCHATRLTSVTEKLCQGMGLRQPDLVTSAQFTRVRTQVHGPDWATRRGRTSACG